LGPIFLRNRSRRGFPHTSHQRSPSRDACHFFDPLLEFCYLAEIGQGPNSVNGTQRYPGGHHFCSAAHTTTSFPGHGDLQKKCSRGNPQRKLCIFYQRDGLKRWFNPWIDIDTSRSTDRFINYNAEEIMPAPLYIFSAKKPEPSCMQVACTQQGVMLQMW